MRTGLVLEGGAMRGMYTAGVLDVWMEENVTFDGIVGVSAGALFGVNFLSGQKGRVIRYNKRFNHDPNYMGIRPLLREGNLISTDYAYRRVPHELDVFDDETFRRSVVPFDVVVTDLITGKPEYIRLRSVFDQMDVLRASGSMPFVSHPVRLNGRDYLDGGVADSIPFRFMLNKGCERPVVVLTRPLDYVKKPMPPKLIDLWYRKYPDFARQLKLRHQVYNDSVAELRRLESEGRVFVVRPSSPIEIGRTETDPDRLQAVYELGLRDAQAQLSALREYLG